MKAITLNNKNAHLILFRINQFFSRNEASQQYSDWGKYPKDLNKMGIKNDIGMKHIEKTIINYILKSKYSIRIENGYGIIINIHKDCGMVIKFGDKVSIYPNQIIIKGFDTIVKKHYTSYISPYSNVDNALKIIRQEEAMSDAYWADADSFFNNLIN